MWMKVKVDESRNVPQEGDRESGWSADSDSRPARLGIENVSLFSNSAR
ncbi:hypothetical protein [Yersinia rohdei]|uniref:Uncharacterized protein n=1 Tax=Yersinia rohdei TaxID=29485 RepID=A0A0U1HQ22_YERRO|nr:hypothetical protein [Yersinia rohdei]CQI88538.1 Uncharacterised protein [Yersinia rohdei]CQJ47270.1 Uncharacterised protein [Yersinia rohdei]